MAKDPLSELVNAYRTYYRLSDQLDFYSGLESLETAIDYAAMARRADGTKHPHQYRLKQPDLRAVRDNLLENRAQLKASQSFADIFHLVRSCAGRGFGPLAIYDTALRLGAYLDRLPDYVYLHAGTRTGAKALGLKVDREYLAMDELPQPIQVLQPYEAEDFLCIYKGQLKNPEAYADATVTGCHPQDPAPENRCHPDNIPAEITTKSGCSS